MSLVDALVLGLCPPFRRYPPKLLGVLIIDSSLICPSQELSLAKGCCLAPGHVSSAVTSDTRIQKSGLLASIQDDLEETCQLQSSLWRL